MVPPDVIVPLLIDHEYAAPTPASGTDAKLPTELPHTDEAAGVTVASGDGFMVTASVPEAEQDVLLVTVTLSVTDPDAPAV